MFIIEDENHAEPQEGEFSTLNEALQELQWRAASPWNKPPNRAPCTSWRTCGRRYEIVEYNTSATPWEEVQRVAALEISKACARWLVNLTTGDRLTNCSNGFRKSAGR